MVRTLLPVALCLSLPAAAWAGDLVPTDPRFGPLRVASHKVEVAVDNQVALTRVEQVFANDHPAQLEAHYVFPVPKGGTIIDFSMTVDGKLVRGELLERDRARQIYEGTLRQSKDPGLLEHAGANVFRARVFPVLPNAEQKIELTYVERVNYDAGACRYSYPLRVPGSKGGTKTDRFELRWRLATEVPLREVASPTHRVDVARKDERSAEVLLLEKQADLSRDLEIVYRLERPKTGMDLAAHRSGDEGTFLLLLTPEAEAPRIAKDVTFVFDTSGSMEGLRIKQARAALKFCLSKLAPDDRFNIVAFASETNPFLERHVEATEKAKEMASKFADSLDASGGTNINDALLRALRHPPDPSRPHLVLFLIDGEPTNGVTDPKAIVKNVLAAGGAGVRIFGFGVGNNLNKELLEELADATRAVAEYVAEDESIEEKVSRLQKKVASPVLSDLSIDWGEAEVSAVYPKVPGELFAGTQLLVTGRYRKAGAFDVTLKGRAGAQAVELRQKLVFPERAEGGQAIPYLWAMRKIASLLDEIRRGGENAETVKQIVAISKEHRIATPYTSFLVLESEAAYDRQGIERKGTKYQPPKMQAAARSTGRNLFATDVPLGTGKVFIPGMNEHLFSQEHFLGDLLRAANPDGSFGPEKVRAGSRTYTRAGTTALVILGFVTSNQWREEAYRGPLTQAALRSLVARQAVGGAIGDDLLNHALATLALSEAWASSEEAAYREPARKAAAHLVSLRKEDGSWGDLVISAVAQLALESARAGKLDGGGQPYAKPGKAFDARPALKPENAGLAAAHLAIRTLVKGEKDAEAAEFLLKEPLLWKDPDLLETFLRAAAIRVSYGRGTDEWNRWHSAALAKMNGRDGPSPSLWPAEAKSVATALSALIDLLGRKER